MGKMKTYAAMFCAMLAMGALTVSCSSEDEAVTQGASGQASIMIDLSSDLSYSRAIDESEYGNIQNYRVSMYKGDEPMFEDSLYSEMTLIHKVDFGGPYTITADYGEDVPYGYDKLYVKGSQTFSVTQGDTHTVSFVCTPANAKLILKYAGLGDSDKFEDYFQDCQVSVKTQYMDEAFSMAKADAGKELYLKTGDEGTEVNLSFTITDLEGETATIESEDFQTTKTITLKPGVAYTLTIKPNQVDVDGGKLGMDITVDNGVTEEDVTITVPGDFLTGATE